MHALYVASVYLHVLAATVWIGGMSFLVLVVVPWLRAGGRGTAAVFLRETGRRFRNVGWLCFAVLILTGTFNLWARGVRLSDFARVEWLASPFGSAIGIKLSLFVLVLVVSGVHDFLLGPRAVEAIARDPTSDDAQRFRRRASILGRANFMLALAIVALAIVLVRGWPW